MSIKTESHKPFIKSKLLRTVISLFLILIIIFAVIVGAGGLFLHHLSKAPDLSQMQSYHPFKSAEAKEEYLKYYDKRSQEWPVASEAKYVETSYGKTYVRISGPKNAPPLVLLPSVSASMHIWMYNVEGLSQHFRVYAVDNIYDFGRSVYTKNISKPEDLTQWLNELFTNLGLTKNINLMGFSYGGWLTSQYALHHPEKLGKIILTAPAATVSQIPNEFIINGILAAIPLKATMNKMVNWAFQDLVKLDTDESRKKLNDLSTDAQMGLKSFAFRMPVSPTVLSNNEIKSISVPTLFIVGEHEVIYDAKTAVNKLNAINPKIKTEIVPNASHDLIMVQSDAFNAKVTKFIEEK